MEDIAPEMLKEIKKQFHWYIDTSTRVKGVLAKLEAGEATYKDAQTYAEKVSDALFRAFNNNLGPDALADREVYQTIAEQVLKPMLGECYNESVGIAESVQQELNQKAGIGMKIKRAALNEDRVNGLVDKISNAESFDEVRKTLQAPVENFCLNVVDETLKSNAELHARAGLNPRIIRKAESGCCKWCSQLEGDYPYDWDEMPEDIFRRHERCRCNITYDPADGSNLRQNVHTKKWTKIDAGSILDTKAKTLPSITRSEMAAVVSNAPCETTAKKYSGYFLRPGAKHSQDFFNVGYTQDDPMRLRFDMAKQFDIAKAVDRTVNENGVETFNIYMSLGVTKERTFLTGWQIDKPGEKPRIITGFRKEQKDD